MSGMTSRSRRVRCRCGCIRTATSRPPQIVDELRAQAALAAQHGFDGVMTSEHHAGFHGYLPNPLQAAGWCLEAMADRLGRAVPVAAAAATARAGRRGDRVAGGALPGTRRPRRRVGRAARRLRDHARADGRPRGSASPPRSRSSPASSTAARPARSPATPRSPRSRQHPIPVLSAAMGFTAVGAPPVSAPDSSSTRCRRPNAAASSSTRSTRPGAPSRACSCAGPGSASHPATTSTTSSRCTATTRRGRRRPPGASRRWSTPPAPTTSSPGSSTRSTVRGATR